MLAGSITVSPVYVFLFRYLRCVNPKFHPKQLTSVLSDSLFLFLVKSNVSVLMAALYIPEGAMVTFPVPEPVLVISMKIVYKQMGR